jgi:hypothetical protein
MIKDMIYSDALNNLGNMDAILSRSYTKASIV